MVQVNVFYNILKRKNVFLDYKNKKLKNLKNWHLSKAVNPWFCKGVNIFPKGLTHGFALNMAIFRIFFLGNSG